VFLVLLSFYFLLRNRFFLSGIVLGLSFLTKFTAGIFLLCFITYFYYKRIEITKSIFFTSGFLVPVIPYLAFNFFLYGSPFLPFIQGIEVISSVLGCNIMRYNGPLFYFIEIFQDNFLNLFLILGLFFVFRKFDRKKLVLLLAFILPLLYHTQMNCRIYRYIIMFLPFISILTGYGIYGLIKKKISFNIIFIIVLLISIPFSFSLMDELYQENAVSEEYYRFQIDNGEIWTSNPLVGLYTDHRLEKIYYPVFNGELSEEFFSYIKSGEAGYVFLDNCGGGIICPEDDTICHDNLDRISRYLDENMNLVFNKTYGRCYYKVFKD